MTCTKCQQPISKGEKYHRTKVGPHHRDCPSQSTEHPKLSAGPMPPVLIMDRYTVSSGWRDGSKRIIVRQGVMGVDSAAAIIHVPANLLPLLAKAIGGA